MKSRFKKILAALVSINCAFINVNAMNSGRGCLKAAKNNRIEKEREFLEERYNQFCFLIYYLVKSRGDIKIILDKQRLSGKLIKPSVSYFNQIIGSTTKNSSDLCIPLSDSSEKHTVWDCVRLLVEKISYYDMGFAAEYAGIKPRISAISCNNGISYNQTKIDKIGSCMNSAIAEKLKAAKKSDSGFIEITENDINIIDGYQYYGFGVFANYYRRDK